MRYAIIIEKAENNYSAYVPDLPGCVTTGKTLEEIAENMKEAIQFHLDGLQEEYRSVTDHLHPVRDFYLLTWNCQHITNAQIQPRRLGETKQYWLENGSVMRNLRGE